jgi:hypothetical protein
MKQAFLFALVIAPLLWGCGGRVAHPVTLERSYDAQLSCTHLAGEYANNMKRLDELLGERKDKTSANIGLLIANPLLLDLSDTQREEAQSIESRNQRLIELMTVRDCRMPDDAMVNSDEAGANMALN